jgi:hypothetical protein
MNYLTIDDAAAWASRFTKKKVTSSNISYLIACSSHHAAQLHTPLLTRRIVHHCLPVSDSI